MTTFPLRALRLRSGEEHRDEIAVEIEPFVLGGERYQPVPSPAAAELTVQRATGGDVFRLAFRTVLHGPCMRCLADAACAVEVDVREYHDVDPEAGDELRSEYVCDDVIDLSAWARDAVADALPDQLVCRPDCAGLCASCGERLDTGVHDHDEEPGDPRWGGLAALRDRLGDE